MATKVIQVCHAVRRDVVSLRFFWRFGRALPPTAMVVYVALGVGRAGTAQHGTVQLGTIWTKCGWRRYHRIYLPLGESGPESSPHGMVSHELTRSSR